MPHRPRLLILGLDGAAYGLMTGWMAAGHLPTFAAFARDALVAPLRCTWPPHTATGWVSLFTGRLPGAHGIFQFWNCQDPNYRLSVTPSRAAGCPILWDALADQGWTVGLLNIPMSHPPGAWPGYQLTWPLTPTLHYCRPPELLRELSSIGGHALPDIACMYDGSPNYPELAQKYIRARTRSVQHLIEQRPTDVVAIVYTEIDRVCHHYWHALDDSHPERARALPADKSVIADTLALIDAAFAQILASVGDDCVVMVVSDHGFGPGTRGLRLHQVLTEGGFCTPRRPIASNASSDQASDDARGTVDYLTALDWARTTAYMPTPGCFGVNLNLAGRQSCGTVSPAEREAVLSAVAEYLLDFPDPLTGKPVFEAILPADQAYAGPYASQAPDLLLAPVDPALMVLHSLDGPMWDRAGQTGLHRLEGIWMLRAPHVSARQQEELVAIEAVAGHVLAALGLASKAIPLPDDARPAGEAASARGLPQGAWSVTRDSATCWPARPSSSASAPHTDPALVRHAASQPIPDTDPEVMERLRAMGYL